MFQAALGAERMLKYLSKETRSFFSGDVYPELGSSLPGHNLWSRGSSHTGHFVGMLIEMSGTGTHCGEQGFVQSMGICVENTLRFRCDAETCSSGGADDARMAEKPLRHSKNQNSGYQWELLCYG